jgi:hypothetical protein
VPRCHRSHCIVTTLRDNCHLCCLSHFSANTHAQKIFMLGERNQKIKASCQSHSCRRPISYISQQINRMGSGHDKEEEYLQYRVRERNEASCHKTQNPTHALLQQPKIIEINISTYEPSTKRSTSLSRDTTVSRTISLASSSGIFSSRRYSGNCSISQRCLGCLVRRRSKGG